MPAASSPTVTIQPLWVTLAVPPLPATTPVLLMVAPRPKVLSASTVPSAPTPPPAPTDCATMAWLP